MTILIIVLFFIKGCDTLKKLTFERIKDPNVIGYAVFAIVEGKLKKVATIENPNKETPVEIAYTPTVNDIISVTGMAVAYKLKHSTIITSMQDGVYATINGNEINNSLIALSKEKQSITIYTRISPSDVVHIKYHIDGIEYIYEGDEYENFIVKAIFNKSNITVGKHYELI